MLNVPEPFWDNDYKLAWPTDSLTSLYKLFPCFYVSFAFDDDATKQFSIAVTPQVRSIFRACMVIYDIFGAI